MKIKTFEIKEENGNVYVYKSNKKIASCFTKERAQKIIDELKNNKKGLIKKQKTK